MSKASDVRDAVVAALKGQLDSSQPVDKFVLPHYQRKDLTSRRVIVRVGNREVGTNQGGDTCNVMIDVGVVGRGPDGSDLESGESYSDAELDEIDEHDGLIETLLDLWIDSGPLRSVVMAEHRFYDVRQGLHIDAARLRKDGVYLSIFQLIYRP